MRITRTALVAIVGGTVAATSAMADTTLTLSSWLPPGHLITRAMVDWAKDVERVSNGRIKSNLLPKAVASPAGTFDAVRNGLADVSWTVHGYTPGRFVLTGVAEFPLDSVNAEAATVAYQRVFERHLAVANEHKNLKPLTMFTTGPAHLYTTKKPIRSVADANGLKARVAGGMAAELAKALGIHGLLKPAPAVYEMLSTGIADGVFFGIEGITAFKIDEIVKYWTRFRGGLYRTSFAVVMNVDAYKKLSSADKAALDSQSGQKFAAKIGQYWDGADRVAEAKMKAKGIQQIDPNQAFIDAILAKRRELEVAWFKQAARKGVDGPKVLQEFRAEVKKVAAGK